jgi:O-antigen/teichoic acid export membrane protein
MYAATNFDRLYLGRSVPLSLLGIYGIARAIAELPTTLARRMSYQIIFPALAGSTAADRRARMGGMGKSRLLFVLALCGGLAVMSALSDIAIRLIYDPRYAQGGWMLSILLMGGVFAVLSNLNEALLLSAGRPLFSSIANALRFATMAVALPGGLALGGFAGAIIAIALTELLQYLYIALGQQRVGLHFWRQDMAAMIVAALLFMALLLGRLAMGWGDPLAGLWNVRA